MKITKAHVNQFQIIKKRFFSNTKIPRLNNWKKMTNNEIWLDFVTQVIVVGGSDASDRFWEQTDLQRLVSYKRLASLKDQTQIKEVINHVLREAGTRYASKDIRKCKKTQALAHVFKILQALKGGPKGLLKRVAQFTGPNATKRRVKYLMKIFKGGFIQSKSARDFLMEKGLIKDAIAIDIRIQNVLKQMGIKMPKGLANNPRVYDSVERQMLNILCKPLRLSGIEFDRMIYQNYYKIMEMKI